jgi:uncharacterized membrane protein YecN with MAPEG domain
METALAAVALHAGLNALVLIGLSVQTGRIRQQERVSIGDGGRPRLIRVMRGHANAIETIPVALLLLLLLALLGAPAWAMHLLGLALTVGRVLHAVHFAAADAPGWQRAAGAGLSALVMLVAALWAVVAGLAAAL